MWHFISGVTKPAEKKKKSAEEKKEYFHTYENKRVRKYEPEWESNRPWLSDSREGLICTICTEFGTDRRMKLCFSD